MTVNRRCKICLYTKECHPRYGLCFRCIGLAFQLLTSHETKAHPDLREVKLHVEHFYEMA